MRYEQTIFIDTTKIYNSKLSGPYNIIREVEPDAKGFRQVEIQFHNTGNIKKCDIYSAVHERVHDKDKNKIDYDKIYMSDNYGPFKFLRELGAHPTHFSRICEVRFLNTNTIATVLTLNALKGKIRDPSLPIVRNKHFEPISEHKACYDKWFGIHNRCYNPTCEAYINYGAKGVTVDPSWINNLEQFEQDICLLPNYDKWKKLNFRFFHLDKDYLQQDLPLNQRVYSKNTCIFIDVSHNSILSYLLHKYDNNTMYDIDKGRCGVVQTVNGNWRVSMIRDYTDIYLGEFTSEEEAIIIYNQAAFSNLYPDEYPVCPHQKNLLYTLNR